MFIYKITNILNSKTYIGQTLGSLEKRWYYHKRDSKTGSKNLLHKAIRKYGEKSFKIELIDTCASQKELDEKEIFYIIETNSLLDKNGYNMCLGGIGRRAWKESKDQVEKRVSKNRKPIICVETKEIFDSVKFAAKKLKCSHSSVSEVVHGRKSKVKGFSFRFLDENLNIKPDERRRKRIEYIKSHFTFGRPVVCLTTGEEFSSVKEAARQNKIAENNLTFHLQGKLKSCKNKIFVYKDKLGDTNGPKI